MNSSTHALSYKGMRNEVRVIFLVVSNGDIFVSSIKHGVLFAEELVQSKGSAGVLEKQDLLDGLCFLGSPGHICVELPRGNICCGRKAVWRLLSALCLALSSAYGVGRAGNSTNCEKSGEA